MAFPEDHMAYTYTHHSMPYHLVRPDRHVAIHLLFSDQAKTIFPCGLWSNTFARLPSARSRYRVQGDDRAKWLFTF